MRRYPVVALAAAIAIAIAAVGRHSSQPRQVPAPAAPVDRTYATSIQPIFDRRCVPCHACYDSPCQLTLQSFEGLDRGANKAIVYFPERALEARPTRMFQDAQTTGAWQSEFDFFPVVDRARAGDLTGSILWRFLGQRADDSGGTGFDVDRTAACPRSIPEVEAELQEHPERGMPFGFPPLTNVESAAIAGWLRRGAGGPPSPPEPEEEGAEGAEIRKWEGFLDGSDPRTPLVSAYLFEHLFYAHLRFDAAPGAWFRIVRFADAERVSGRRDPDTAPLRRSGPRPALLPTPPDSRDPRGEDARPLPAERREARPPPRALLRRLVELRRPGLRPTIPGARPIRSSPSRPSRRAPATSFSSTTRATTSRRSSTAPYAGDRRRSTSSRSISSSSFSRPGATPRSPTPTTCPASRRTSRCRPRRAKLRRALARRSTRGRSPTWQSRSGT